MSSNFGKGSPLPKTYSRPLTKSETIAIKKHSLRVLRARQYFDKNFTS